MEQANQALVNKRVNQEVDFAFDDMSHWSDSCGNLEE